MVDLATKSRGMEPTLADLARATAKVGLSKLTLGERCVVFLAKYAILSGIVLSALAVVGVLFRLNIWLWFGN